MTVDSYPLSWPSGYRRTKSASWSRFGKHSLFEARNVLKEEVRRLGGSNLVISTNMRTRTDGDVYSNAREPDDSGVAVYFQRKQRPICLACDTYHTVWENTYAIAKSIEAMRSIDRWGVSEMLDRMFVGFPAVTDGTAHWTEVLAIDRHASREEVKAAYRRLISERHPDRGGTDEEATRLNDAYAAALKEITI